MIHTITKLTYAFFGLLFLFVGISLVSYKTGVLPASVAEIIFNQAQHNDSSLHLLQEFGSLMVFTGILSFWFILDYNQSKKFHVAMIIFWALMAIIHWTDTLSHGGRPLYAIVNTVPFLLFAVTGALRNKK